MGDKDMEQRLNIDDLEQVAGGYIEHSQNMFTQTRFYFSEAEVNVVKNALNITLIPNHGYTRKELNAFGIMGSNNTAIENELSKIGLHYVRDNY